MKRWAKIRELSRLFSEYATAQAVIQVLGILAGLWLVNFLPVREYALYTFGLSIFTFLSVFSDLGSTSALLYFRRETRVAQAAFVPYVRAALRFRHRMLLLGACVGLTFMALVGRDRGFDAGEIAATGAALVAAVWFQVGASVSLLQLRLEGKYWESYFADMCGNAVRLGAVAAMWLATGPFAWLAMLTGASGALITNIVGDRRLRIATEVHGAAVAPDHRDPMKSIVRYVLPMSVSAAYFSIQAPLVVWLCAYFASTESVAQVGALGRLGLLFGLLSGFVGAVLIPRLAVITDDAHYLRRYLQYWAILVSLGAGVIVLAHIVPHWLLFLLGNAYSGLESSVLVIAVSSVLSTWGGYVVGINNARGWVRRQPILLGIFASLQAGLIMVLDLSTTLGVLYFGLWCNLAGLVMQAGISAIGFVRPHWVIVRK